jgi:hypothetical protein
VFNLAASISEPVLNPTVSKKFQGVLLQYPGQVGHRLPMEQELFDVALTQDMAKPVEQGTAVEWNQDKCIYMYFKNLDAIDFQASI